MMRLGCHVMGCCPAWACTQSPLLPRQGTEHGTLSSLDEDCCSWHPDQIVAASTWPHGTEAAGDCCDRPPNMRAAGPQHGQVLVHPKPQTLQPQPAPSSQKLRLMWAQ